ncbi:MAG: 4Fe-4S binding protein [Syntrophaceae bacterium]
MRRHEINALHVIVYALMLVLFVAGLSSLRSGGEKQSTPTAASVLIVEPGMRVADFGVRNHLSDPVLKNVFHLKGTADFNRGINTFGLSGEQIRALTSRALILNAEESSKSWPKIALKFGLWLGFLVTAFVFMRREAMTPILRKTMYLAAVIVFGIALGSDPNPMGTVKDAIALYGSYHIIFPPRLAAFLVFIATVMLANKFICAWGCQFGTLQDLVFRLNRNHQDTRGILPQYKPPFVFTNTVRIIFFITFVGAALIWSFDVIKPIDPFKIFMPRMMLIGGGIFLIGILSASLFIYRPWCHFFCPFGLAGWLAEKLSVYKIAVNYQTCIGCETCAKACPSTVMHAILKRDTVIPDCFACGTCIQACPTRSIQFRCGKRMKPPIDNETIPPAKELKHRVP